MCIDCVRYPICAKLQSQYKYASDISYAATPIARLLHC